MMRDPIGNVEQYEEVLGDLRARAQTRKDKFSEYPPETKVWISASQVYDDSKLLAHMYGAGVPIPVLKATTAERLAGLVAAGALVRDIGPALSANWVGYRAVQSRDREAYPLAAFALLLLDSEQQPKQWEELVATAPDKRSYLIDLLTRAFVPMHEIAKQYKADKVTAPFVEPLLRALAQSPEARPAAFEKCMKNWCATMKVWGWKPNLDTRPGHDELFCDFAFEIALAVCAYDIDDTAFAGHPYYPRDLVEYYRANIRHTRDAWRADKVGAGVEIIAPPPPKKADLAKSKRKAFARWVELVCDGDEEAIAAVIEAVGRPRKVQNLFELGETLAEQGHAIQADIKDDDTLELQADSMLQSRGLGGFEAPAGPPFGPARCSATLLGLAQWTAERGYMLVGLNNDDDAWNAVLVKTQFHDELRLLSSTLGIAAHPASVASWT